MKLSYCSMTIVVALVCACSGQRDADREPGEPRTAVPAPPVATDPIPERPPIDIGDVDSGIRIEATLAPESTSATASADYVRTLRDMLSMTTITVRPPFPETLLVQFSMLSSRDFVERPVIVRARAYRDEGTEIGEQHAYVMGRTARFQEPEEALRIFLVNVLEGLENIPDTMLVHARADAWLTELGTDEDSLDPATDTGPERVALISNPVRINFIREEAES